MIITQINDQPIFLEAVTIIIIVVSVCMLS